MRNIILLIFLAAANLVQAQDWEDRKLFGPSNAQQVLRVLSSTDVVYLDTVLSDFVRTVDGAQIEYLVTGTADINDIIRKDPDAYDVVISSAMDLQVKLTNDGFAKPLRTIERPDWMQWRQSLFGFSAEPAAIVVNTAAFKDLGLPRTRQELISLFRAEPDLFRDKIATYDIRRSGLGYFFATQDARASETFWRFTEVIGNLGTRLYCCSGEMITAVAKGDVLVAYNVLGSYAATQALADPRIQVIVPEDFATTMMRTIFVTRNTSRPKLAESFVAHLLEAAESREPVDRLQLPPLESEAGRELQKVVPLEPSLMIYLDRLSRKAFTLEWESAIIQ
ncbi:ABC transporter substrate-binding protein [Epibacterium sp. SM1979]|uniref:ABC transporter substrate-binding protein n=1 Tax=Tritonibacter litoralis TaxID=2662264 RepID=A0A843YE40_9RHOB|nr:ABC transporter substrate-binding protein [Tritonibacter litoralis]MQQ09670.1 ABC transporter substrate-binding protein [Tritonibacter litoralis]